MLVGAGTKYDVEEYCQPLNDWVIFFQYVILLPNVVQ